MQLYFCTLPITAQRSVVVFLLLYPIQPPTQVQNHCYDTFTTSLDSLQSGRVCVRTPVRETDFIFSTPVQTGPGTTQSPVQWFPVLSHRGGVNKAGAWRWPSSPFVAEFHSPDLI